MHDKLRQYKTTDALQAMRIIFKDFVWIYGR